MRSSRSAVQAVLGPRASGATPSPLRGGSASRSDDGVGVARDQRAWDSRSSFNQTRYEIAASPHPAALRASTLPIKGRVGKRFGLTNAQQPQRGSGCAGTEWPIENQNSSQFVGSDTATTSAPQAVIATPALPCGAKTSAWTTWAFCAASSLTPKKDV